MLWNFFYPKDQEMEEVINNLSKLNVNSGTPEIKTSKIKYGSGYTQIIRTNVEGKLHGNQELYDNNRMMVSMEQYVNGFRDGVTRKYVNDVLVYELNYKNNELHGLCREWDTEGHMLSSIEYENGYKHGKSVIYIRAHDQIRYTEYYRGVVHGYDIAVEGDINVMEMTYRMGIPCGKKICRHSNGKVRQECEYVNGEVEGVVIEYDEDGDVMSMMKCVGGRYVGEIDAM